MLKNHVISDAGLINDVTEDTEDIQTTVNDIEADVAVIDGIVDDILEDTIDIQSTVNDIEADVAVVDTVVDAIKVTTDALPTLTETGGTVTTDGTEQNVYVNTSPLGVFRPVCLKIDFTNQTATETVVIREYYQIKAGVGIIRKHDELTFAGVQDPVLIGIDLDPNRFGVKVTIQKTGGDNKAYDWEPFYEI